MTVGSSPNSAPFPVPPMRWDAWGDPELATPLSEGTSTLADEVQAAVERALGKLEPGPHTIAAAGRTKTRPTPS